MKKLARELPRWPQELGEDRAAASLSQVREYLNSPPDLTGDHLTAGRDLYVTFLTEAGPMVGLYFSAAADRLRTVIEIIPQLADALRDGRLEEAGGLFGRIAKEESQAYYELSEILGLEDLTTG
jgi:hypothetical protein